MTLPPTDQLADYARVMIARICQNCPHFEGRGPEGHHARAKCSACKNCGGKLISPAYQACPVDKFESGLKSLRMDGAAVPAADRVHKTVILSQLPELEKLGNGDAFWNDFRVQMCNKCPHANKFAQTCGQSGKKIWDAITQDCPLDRFRVHQGGMKMELHEMVKGQEVGPRHPNSLLYRRPPAAPNRVTLAASAAAEIGLLTEPQRRAYFDKVIVINLQKRPERLAAFRAMLAAAGWPFAEPEILSVKHGDELGVPAWWKAGGGAWGCMLSHRRVLEDGLRDGAQRILVLEDDCTIAPGQGGRLAEFLERVPTDWDQIMFGGQMFGDSREVAINEQVRMVTQCERTHCYALTRDAARSLWHWWQRPGAGGHCDHQMGDWQDSGVRCYAPRNFLAGQAGGQSDIAGKVEGERYWNGARAAAPTRAIAPVVVVPAVERLPIEGPPRVWWHIACMGTTWREVVTEQAKLLMESFGTEGKPLDVGIGILGAEADRSEAKGILAAAGVRPCVFLPGTISRDQARAILETPGIRPEPLYESADLLEYEIPTMEMMWQAAMGEAASGAVDEQWIYLHTKGVSTGDENKASWRKLMERHVLEGWLECRRSLGEADAAGICWRGDPGEQYPHFSGNIWSARRSYLRHLPSPLNFSTSRGGTYAGNPWNRMAAEMWIGTGRPAVHEIWRPEGGRLDLTAERDFLRVQTNSQNFSMPPKHQLDAQYGADCKHFVHSGKIGDLVYALPAIRAMGGGVIWLDNWQERTKLKVTPELVEQQIKPLLMAGAADYVRDVRFCEWRPRTFEIDLNGWRQSQDTGNICYDHLKLLGLSFDLADKEWMSFGDLSNFPKVINGHTHYSSVVFCRSSRYHNPEFDWKRLYARYAWQAIFLGLPAEHAEFEREFGPIRFLMTETILEAARFIAGADLVICNKSALCAIATATGRHQIIEMDQTDAMFPSVKMSLGDGRPSDAVFGGITAVILCKGRLSRLKASVSAARRCGLQVIVVDANCPDSSGEWVEGLGDTSVKCVRYAGDFSLAAAKNSGLSQVTTPYTMILDVDVILWPMEFSLQMQRFGLSPRHFLYRRDSGLDGWVIFPTGTAMLDEDFTGYGREDDALFFSLEKAGLKGLRMAEKFAHHIGHGDDERMKFLNNSKDQDLRRNTDVLVRKFGAPFWSQ